jgi:hypothetical protein
MWSISRYCGKARRPGINGATVIGTPLQIGDFDCVVYLDHPPFARVNFV